MKGTEETQIFSDCSRSDTLGQASYVCVSGTHCLRIFLTAGVFEYERTMRQYGAQLLQMMSNESFLALVPS